MTEEARIALALVGAGAITYLPVFAYKLVSIPVRRDAEHKAQITRLIGGSDAVDSAIAELREQEAKSYSPDGSIEMVELDFLLAVELAEMLTSQGITPSQQYGGWADDETYKGPRKPALARVPL